MRNLSLLFLALFVLACGQSPNDAAKDASSAKVDEAITKQVFDHHVQTFQANDLEGVMADYTEASVLITPDKTFKGLAEIRQNFVGAFQALPTSGTTMTVTSTVISGNVAYFVWKATTPTLEFKYATDTFIIEDGKIISQTFAGDIVPAAGPQTQTPGE